MPSNNSKYSLDMREQTARFVLETGKSASSMAEELEIDVNTVCRWVCDYRRKNNMPSYAESKGMKRAAPKSQNELLYRVGVRWFYIRGKCININIEIESKYNAK